MTQRNTHQRVAAHLADLAKDKDAETKDTKPKKRTANRMGEDELIADYPHVKPGTLGFLADENKQVVTITCQAPKDDGSGTCGRERKVRTSDLWQVDKCHACTRKARRAKAKAKRAEAKANKSTEG